MLIYALTSPDGPLRGTIRLDGSKSISNRCLLIRALSGEAGTLEHLSTSNDTTTLLKLLQIWEHQQQTGDGRVELDAGAAGTTFRFMTALMAISPGNQVLTGSERMLSRPIGVLVDALKQLGASIRYLGAVGYPPLEIGSANLHPSDIPLEIPADTSSQFISALLMIGPALPGGLRLRLKGDVVSRPYIRMTLRLMEEFGVTVSTDPEERAFDIKPQSYTWKPFRVEADWSAASYYYSMAALRRNSEIRLQGLTEEGWQGDAILARMFPRLGVDTEFEKDGIVIRSTGRQPSDTFEADFLECPDLAQTVAVVCAGLGIPARLTGLGTLRIKETDRIDALRQELGKVSVRVQAEKTDRDEWMELEGKANWRQSPVFATYEDHRMAMAIAPLALLGPVQVSEPGVVGKSYPTFWEDMEVLGFSVEEAGE